MVIVFIDPHYQKAVVFNEDYSRISEFLKDFMVHKKIEGMDFLLGNYGDWEIYSKIGTSMKFCGTIAGILMSL